jgi:type I restriction enzyme M protein
MAKLNERKTERLVEARLAKHGYEADGSDIILERQSSDKPRIQKLLSAASKKGTGVGRPEYIIHSETRPGFIIVIECKADPKKHASVSLDKYADYALDGALLYASFLAKEFDVLAIAVSGQDEASLRISHHLVLKSSAKSVAFNEAEDILSFDEYHEAFSNSDIKFRQYYESLIDFSRALNNSLQAKKVTESERAFLISGILIGLQNSAFRNSYASHKTGKQLATNLLSTIKGEFESARLPEERRDVLELAFSFISKSPALLGNKDYFVDLIASIDKNINNFRKTHLFYDIIGQFYVEFLRYANNDKGLGIVLTPPHIAELFAELADVNKDSIVLDNCCGTAGLLIAAMSKMMRDAGADKAAQKKVKTKGLVGVEFQPKVYALAVSNMILHGDGKTNIVRGDCFQDGARALKIGRPTVGLLNPPYKNKSVQEDREELEFVLNNLNMLAPGGKCVAIVPMTCATSPSGQIADWKKAILQKHTLEGVMSMPISLFHNSKTTVVTCIMVFTSHIKHPKGKKSWFGYWRDDGFVKTKHRGRIDLNGTWASIRTTWVDAFRNRDVIPGMSITREVGPNDEWCAEAYLPLDYQSITPEMLSDVAKQFVLSSSRSSTPSGVK